MRKNKGNMYSSHMELDRDFENGQGLWFHRASSLIIKKAPWFWKVQDVPEWKRKILFYFNSTLALSDDS